MPDGLILRTRLLPVSTTSRSAWSAGVTFDVVELGPRGVTEFEADDAGPVPMALVAVTVNVYEVPFVKPVTVSGPLLPDAVCPPGCAVTVYDVIDLPPLLAGGV